MEKNINLDLDLLSDETLGEIHMISVSTGDSDGAFVIEEYGRESGRYMDIFKDAFED